MYKHKLFINILLKGETDWKVIGIDVNDPLAENLNDINDVDKIMPGFLKVFNKLSQESCLK